MGGCYAEWSCHSVMHRTSFDVLPCTCYFMYMSMRCLQRRRVRLYGGIGAAIVFGTCTFLTYRKLGRYLDSRTRTVEEAVIASEIIAQPVF